MKKKLIISVSAVLAVCLLYLVGTGLMRVSTVFVSDFTILEDGTEITLSLQNTSSMGYIRRAAVHQQHGGKLYLDCYAAFGGLNGAIGAKSSYTVPLDEETTVIALYRSRDCYQTVLQKDGNGRWQLVSP